MVTKYNLFTVHKWVFTTLESILYKENLTFSYALVKIAHVLPFYDAFA